MNKQANKQMRQCCLTKIYKPKAQLMRIVYSDNYYTIDWTQTKQTRGYYVDRSPAVLAKLSKKNYLQKIIRDPENYKIIQAQIQVAIQKN